MKPRNEENGAERRQDQRLEIAVPLQLRLPDLDAVFSGRAINVSRSGMFIPMESPPPVGTHLHIDLSAQEEQLLDATVEVVRRVDDERSSGVGVRFLEISFGAEALIDRMVADQNLFGDYHLEALLGQGGMAEVYRARDLSSDEAGRIVALKRILPELTRDQHIARLFRKEAAVARRLNHANIIQIYDVGEVEGTIYIAMEYVDGCHLGQLITLCAARAILLPTDVACYLGQSIADALHYAHGARDQRGKPLGLVHRDVTPSNLFLSHLGDVKLGDFGVAMVRHGQGEEPGERVGKDLYAAPEQLLGAPLTPSADVYGIGAVLFELLTHHAAFEEDPEAKLTQTPPSVGDLRSDVPEAVAAVITRAMSPMPPNTDDPRLAEPFAGVEPRYPDCATLSAALTEAYNPAVGNRLAIAAIMRGLFA